MRVDRSYQLLDGVDGLFASVEAAALAERDFVITGDNEALVQFRQAATNFKTEVGELTPLVRDEPTRTEDLSRIDQAIASEFDKFTQVIEVRKVQGYDGARAVVALQGTSVSMGNLRRQIAAMTEAERQVVNARIEVEKRHERHVVVTGVSVAAISILVRIGIALWMRRMARPRKDGTAGVALSKLDLGSAAGATAP
jgi:CHASE3 domain sensor protein